MVARGVIESANLIAKDDEIPKANNRAWNTLTALQESIDRARVICGNGNTKRDGCGVAKRFTTIDRQIEPLALGLHLPKPCINAAVENRRQEAPVDNGQRVIPQRLP